MNTDSRLPLAVSALRAGALLVVAGGAYLVVRAFSVENADPWEFFGIAMLARATYGALILAATDRIRGARRWVSEDVYFVAGIVSTAVVGLYLGIVADSPWGGRDLQVAGGITAAAPGMLLVYLARPESAPVRRAMLVMGGLLAIATVIQAMEGMPAYESQFAFCLVFIVAGLRANWGASVKAAPMFAVLFAVLGLVAAYEALTERALFPSQTPLFLLLQLATTVWMSMLGLALVGWRQQPAWVAVSGALVITGALVGAAAFAIQLSAGTNLFIGFALSPVTWGLLIIALALALRPREGPGSEWEPRIGISPISSELAIDRNAETALASAVSGMH